MKAPEVIGFDWHAEDELLAAVARILREGAVSPSMPILRVVGEREGVDQELREHGLPTGHQRVSRRDWRHGFARCHNCRRAVDIHDDTLRLHTTGGPPGDDVVVFECPRCDKLTHFHIEVTA